MTEYVIVVAQTDWLDADALQVDAPTFYRLRDVLKPGTHILIYEDIPVQAITAVVEVTGYYKSAQDVDEIISTGHAETAADSIPVITSDMVYVPIKAIHTKGEHLLSISLKTIQQQAGLGDFPIPGEIWVQISEDTYDALTTLWGGAE